MSEAILVTGGSGFIGTWVLKAALQQGLRPVVLDVQPNPGRWKSILGADSDKVSFVAGDLCDLALLRKIADEHQVSRIIHLAALLTPQCQTDPLLGCRVNVMGSTALFELARSCAGQIRGISYASSYAVYGPEADDPDSGTRAEDNRPPSFYGAFKLAVDLIAEQYWRHFQIASVGIRPHVVYGPERTVGLTAAPSLAAKAAARNESFAINYTARLSYDYVEDVASAFVRAAVETPPGSVVLDLPGNVATSEEFAQTIMQVVPESAGRISVSGNPIPSNIPPQPSYFTQRYPDWHPCSLAEGIRRTADFYRTDRQ
jgi:nucleoside-diphosphate-sugar epimerase